MLVKDEGICIRAIDYSETSQIVTFFTRRSGKIRFIAKGSKRRKSAFDGPIEPFSAGTIVFSDTSRDKLATLTEFEMESSQSSDSFTTDLFTLNCCLFAAELLNSLTDDYDPHPQLFEALKRFLKELMQKTNNKSKKLSLLILFQLTLLKEVGLKPVLDICANCKNRFSSAWRQFYFSSSANGLICRDCEGSFPDRLRLSAQVASSLSNPETLPKADEQTLREIEEVLIHYFTQILHRRPRMAKFILKY